MTLMVCGCRLLQVPDQPGGEARSNQPDIPVALLYPAHGEETSLRFGPYSLEAALDAPMADGAFPLVVVSHGNGGTPWGYRVLAKLLVNAGYCVALLEHPSNNRHDNSLTGTLANLENRPRHVSKVIDALQTDPMIKTGLTPDIAVIGHSVGGYTALSAVGGQAWYGLKDGCGPAQAVEVQRDSRIRAIALLAPALYWFIAGSLDLVDVPIFIRTGEHDAITPPAHVTSVLQQSALQVFVDHRIVPGAGHFSFMSPFPAPMVRPGFAPSQDPVGFDRAAFQYVMLDELTAFFRTAFA